MKHNFNLRSPRGSDGRVFRNDGPINPVDDIDSAHTMAKSELKVLNAYRSRRAGRLKHPKYDDGSRATELALLAEDYQIPTNVRERMDRASELSRSTIAGNSLEKAFKLFCLTEVEFVPVSDTQQSEVPDTQQSEEV